MAISKLAVAIAVLCLASCGLGRTDLESDDAVMLAKLAVAAKEAETCWPGYKLFSSPLMLVRNGKSAILVEHPHPPAGFSSARFGGLAVFVSKSPPDIGPFFRRSYDLNGVPTTAIRYDDKQPPATTIAIAVHEHFHDFQDSWKMRFYDEKYRTKDAQDLAMAAVEQECLARALESPKPDDLDCVIALRTSRYARFPVATVERDQERGEGTARFVDYQSRARAYGPKEALPDLVARLRRPLSVDQMGNSRSYLTGAALCYILAREGHESWQREIESGEGPYDLVAKRHPLPRADASRIIAALMRSPRYIEILGTARRKLVVWQKRRRDALVHFRRTPGIHVRLMTSRMRNAGKLSTYFTSSGQEIEVEAGKTLIKTADTFQSKAPGWDCEVRNRALLFGEDAEFVVSSSAAIVIDGHAWMPKTGTTSFQTFELREPGAELKISDGNAKLEGRTLEIFQ